MGSDESYRWLIRSAEGAPYDEFDIHVVASIFALAMREAEEGAGNFCEGVGLVGSALMALTAAMFPGAKSFFERVELEGSLDVDNEEQSLRDILGMYSLGNGCLERSLAAMIARRCKSPHHLWQDLGLRNRGELSRLMKRHFSRLAEKNQHDMKWKKFLYRMVCGSHGFTLCSSPVCTECDDYMDCFGTEEGESRLANAATGIVEKVT